jgi:hypothetical protein
MPAVRATPRPTRERRGVLRMSGFPVVSKAGKAKQKRRGENGDPARPARTGGIGADFVWSRSTGIEKPWGIIDGVYRSGPELSQAIHVASCFA